MNEIIRESVNKICRYLALRDISELNAENILSYCQSKSADVIMVLGSDLPQLVKAGCEAYLNGFGNCLLFCGGKGHSTENLKRKISSILKCDMELLPESEAELYAYLAQENYGIPKEAILLEKNSTNTMENLKFGKNVLDRHGIPYGSVLLMQDPLLQRRSYVTALDFFEKNSCLLSYAPFIPGMDPNGRILPDEDYLWARQRFLELLMGEIWRLRDDEHGYGPNGAGFLRHVEIPEETEQAYKLLLDKLPEYAARCRYCSAADVQHYTGAGAL